MAKGSLPRDDIMLFVVSSCFQLLSVSLAPACPFQNRDLSVSHILTDATWKKHNNSNESKGAFLKSVLLAGRTMAAPVILKMK